VNVLDHGLLYGDGVFEGMRFRHGRVFRLDSMLARLFRSAAAIGLRPPLSRDKMAQAVEELISAYTVSTGRAAGYIRLVVTRGVGKLGIDPGSCFQAGIYMIAGELTMVGEKVRAEGASLITASTRKPGPASLDPRIKSLNYLTNIMARMEAAAAGADEAVMLNPAGYVAEGTAQNIFAARAGVLITPPPSDGALEGITRGAVLEVARELGIEAFERRLALYDLYTADEIFLTGTGAGLIPILRVDGRDTIIPPPGPIFLSVSAAYEELVDRETMAEAARNGSKAAAVLKL